MMNEVKNMTRKQLREFLESKGFKTYDDESTQELRIVAMGIIAARM